MADEQDQEHEDAFVYYCEQRSQEYHRIFGMEEPEGQILLAPTDLSLFAWPGGGVYQFAPQGTLTDWHYVTEAISQPHNPAEAIKNGNPDYAFELVMSTKGPCAWAPNVLMNLARYYFSKRRPFCHNEAIPCGGPLVIGWDTKLTFLIAIAAQEYNPVIHLPGGDCVLVHLVGVTEEELKPALESQNPNLGIQALYRVLCKHGIGSCSIPERSCLSELPSFLAEWQAEFTSIANDTV